MLSTAFNRLRNRTRTRVRQTTSAYCNGPPSPRRPAAPDSCSRTGTESIRLPCCFIGKCRPFIRACSHSPCGWPPGECEQALDCFQSSCVPAQSPQVAQSSGTRKRRNSPPNPRPTRSTPGCIFLPRLTRREPTFTLRCSIAVPIGYIDYLPPLADPGSPAGDCRFCRASRLFSTGCRFASSA